MRAAMNKCKGQPRTGGRRRKQASRPRNGGNKVRFNKATTRAAAQLIRDELMPAYGMQCRGWKTKRRIVEDDVEGEPTLKRAKLLRVTPNKIVRKGMREGKLKKRRIVLA